MTVSTTVCGTCSGTVPAGRLSCPNCGELLASVVGGRVAVAASVATSGDTDAPAQEGAAAAAAPPPILYDPATAPTNAVLDGDIATAETALLWPDDADAADDAGDADDAATDPTAAAPAVASLDPVADADPRSADTAAATYAATYAGPGAYLPPAATLPERPAPPPVIQPAGPAAPARAWAGTSVAAASAAPPRSDDSATSTALAGAVASDAARISEFVGWLAVAGGALASVGFLLPWSNVAVIGARGVGYFDRWGLAGPLHVVVVVGLLAVLALAIVRNPVPAWARIGIAGGGLAALLLGLTWPYLLGPLGAGPGVLCVALGAVLLGVAAVVAIVADRRTGTDRAV